MRQVLLYDTTLRDGMQGQGMTLSAQEKVRVVRKLDELGVHFLYDAVHHLEEDVHGGVLGWLVNTAASAVLGLLIGAVVVAATHRRGSHA